ncbi:MAG TPA: DUF58 domain-containing protein [Planctomycetia bacterium]|nr:DUF58 domain-containing protein [Planctomycetia bacterium]
MYLDPHTLAKVKDLELKARRTIEGLVSGAHRSPYQGVSVEFAEHREYVPGDDVRHVDWKLYGKTDKIYLKRYEQETNLVCNLVIDSSQSMAYGSAGIPKLFYASQLAASLAYLVIYHQDSVGMTFFEDRVRYHVPASGQPSQLRQLLHLLAVCQPANLKSQVGKTLDEMAERFTKRSLVALVSDCFDDLDAIVAGLKHLRYKRHEVIVFHVLDPAEIEFPFSDVTLFKGLEQYPDLLADPRGLRDAYRESFQAYLKRIYVACKSAGVDYQLVRTDRPLDQLLIDFLASRN